MAIRLHFLFINEVVYRFLERNYLTNNCGIHKKESKSPRNNITIIQFYYKNKTIKFQSNIQIEYSIYSFQKMKIALRIGNFLLFKN